MKKSNYLCIGHCCHDVVKDGYILGGAASYASLVAKKLGRQPCILTSVGTDFQFHNHFTQLDIPLVNIEADKTTVFHNVYEHGGRTQYMLDRANVIKVEDIPADFMDSEVVHLCLIADEVDFAIIEVFPKSLIAVTLQGSLRQWDDHGLISPKAMDWNLLSGVDIVIVSEDDIKGLEEHLSSLKANVNQLIITRGKNGADVYIDSKAYHFPSLPIEEVEATGAGDVFTSAYLIEYQRTGNISAACIFAHCAASFVIEGIGVDRLPSTEDIHSRVKEYEKHFNI